MAVEETANKLTNGLANGVSKTFNIAKSVSPLITIVGVTGLIMTPGGLAYGATMLGTGGEGIIDGIAHAAEWGAEQIGTGGDTTIPDSTPPDPTPKPPGRAPSGDLVPGADKIFTPN